jgi:hypothetical protein
VSVNAVTCITSSCQERRSGLSRFRLLFSQPGSGPSTTARSFLQGGPGLAVFETQEDDMEVREGCGSNHSFSFLALIRLLRL